MQKRLLLIIGSILVTMSIVIMTYTHNRHSIVNVMTKELEESLAHTQGKGLVKDLIHFNYDKVYVFEPYQAKESMEALIGFKCSILEETVSEGMMNMLFVEGEAPVAYLYGYVSNNGYYIELPIGTYSRSELDEMSYVATKQSVGNSGGTPLTYIHYLFAK